MKNLIGIFILTLVLATGIHSYVLEARESEDDPAGPGDGPGGGEPGEQGCETILVTVEYFNGASCTGTGTTITDYVGLCEGEDYIPLGHCITVADQVEGVSVSRIEVTQLTTEVFQCTVYSDNACKNAIATTSGACAPGSGTNTNDIKSIMCFDPDA